MQSKDTCEIVKVDGSQRLYQKEVELQEIGTLRELPIALDASAPIESCELLNQILTYSIISYSAEKKHHLRITS